MADDKTEIERLRREISELRLITDESTLHRRCFLEDPSSVAKNCLILDNRVLNFDAWKRRLTRNMNLIFPHIRDFLDHEQNFDQLTRFEEEAIHQLLVHTIDPGISTSLAADDKSAKALYKAICHRSSGNTRPRLLELAGQLLNLQKFEDLESFAISGSEVAATLMRSDLDKDQLLGLLLHASAPLLFCDNTNLLHHNVLLAIDREHSPPGHHRMIEIIQEEHAVITNIGSTSGNPINLASSQVTTSQPKRYPLTTHLTHTRSAPNTPRAPSTRPTTSRLYHPKHIHYVILTPYGLPSSKDVITFYGNSCSYCGEKGHWYADCLGYEKAFDTLGYRMPVPPSRRFSSHGSTSTVRANAAAVSEPLPPMAD